MKRKSQQGMTMDVNSMCRTCLKENVVDMKSIFCKDKNNQLADMIMAITTSVAESDGLPQKICIECSENVEKSYHFKKQAELSYLKLKDLFGLLSDQKRSKNNDINLVDESVKTAKYSKIDVMVQTDEACLNPCEMCHLNFFSEDSLKEHRKLHSSINCRVCAKKFANITNLRRHITAVHKDITISKPMRNIVCDICNEEFNRNDRLKHHMKMAHSIDIDIDLSSSYNKCDKIDEDPKCLKCSHCNKLFLNETEHKEHIHKCDKEKSPEALGKKRGKKQFDTGDTENVDNTDVLIGSTINDSKLPPASIVKPRKKQTIKKGQNIPVELVQVEKVLLQEDNTKLVQPNEQHKVDNNVVVETSAMSVFEVVMLDTIKTENVEEEFVLRTFSIADFPTCTAENIKQDQDDVDKNNTIINSTKDPNRNNDDEDKEEGVKSDTDCCNDNDSTMSSSSSEKDLKQKPKRKLAKKFECSKCKKTFMDQMQLNQHMLDEHSKKGYSCEVCNTTFTRIDHLNIHRFGHQGRKPFACDLCGKAFFKEEEVARHKETENCLEPPTVEYLICDICDKKCTSLKGIKLHMRSHRINEFICETCNKKYTKRRAFIDHVKRHKDERPFMCNVCGFRFVKKDNLNTHMRRHIGGEKPYKCKYCEKSFARLGDLKVHERYHTGEKKYICTTCGKAFSASNALGVHNRVHTGEKPFKCQQCGQAFSQSNDLKTHIRRHTGERYKCNICSKDFIQLHLLNKHKRTVHGIEIESNIKRLAKFLPSDDPVDGSGASNACNVPPPAEHKKLRRKPGPGAAEAAMSV